MRKKNLYHLSPIVILIFLFINNGIGAFATEDNSANSNPVSTPTVEINVGNSSINPINTSDNNPDNTVPPPATSYNINGKEVLVLGNDIYSMDGKQLKIDTGDKFVHIYNNIYDGAFLSLNNSKEVAQLVKEIYKTQNGKELDITVDSLRAEIYVHTIVYVKKISPERGSRATCAEGSIDDNRNMWDKIEDTQFSSLKRNYNY